MRYHFARQFKYQQFEERPLEKFVFVFRPELGAFYTHCRARLMLKKRRAKVRCESRYFHYLENEILL